jgi:SET domain-containing protein
MLLVRTYLDKSAIDAIGLFAAEPIEAGTVVWKLYDIDIVMHETALREQKLTSLQLDFIETYSYKNGNTYYLCIDDARFMNHSPTPNTREAAQSSIASRRIEAGGELTCNYGNFDDGKRDLPYCRPPG